MSSSFILPLWEAPTDLRTRYQQLRRSSRSYALPTTAAGVLTLVQDPRRTHSTGLHRLDALLKGCGLRSGTLSEVYGPSGCGKTHLAMACVRAFVAKHQLLSRSSGSGVGPFKPGAWDVYVCLTPSSVPQWCTLPLVLNPNGCSDDDDEAASRVHIVQVSTPHDLLSFLVGLATLSVQGGNTDAGNGGASRLLVVDSLSGLWHHPTVSGSSHSQRWFGAELLRLLHSAALPRLLTAGDSSGGGEEHSGRRGTTTRENTLLTTVLLVNGCAYYNLLAHHSCPPRGTRGGWLPPKPLGCHGWYRGVALRLFVELANYGIGAITAAAPPGHRDTWQPDAEEDEDRIQWGDTSKGSSAFRRRDTSRSPYFSVIYVVKGGTTHTTEMVLREQKPLLK